MPARGRGCLFVYMHWLSSFVKRFYLWPQLLPTTPSCNQHPSFSPTSQDWHDTYHNSIDRWLTPTGWLVSWPCPILLAHSGLASNHGVTLVACVLNLGIQRSVRSQDIAMLDRRRLRAARTLVCRSEGKDGNKMDHWRRKGWINKAKVRLIN